MLLRAAEEVRDQAVTIVAIERARRRALGVEGQLHLTGGTSVAGALTRGDVDLHLRVRPAAFAAVVARLRSVYLVVHPEIWAATLATFTVPAALPTGIAVTPAGSEHDLRFTRTWQLLATDPGPAERVQRGQTRRRRRRRRGRLRGPQVGVLRSTPHTVANPPGRRTGLSPRPVRRPAPNERAGRPPTARAAQTARPHDPAPDHHQANTHR
jgi:hypothetical protein